MRPAHWSETSLAFWRYVWRMWLVVGIWEALLLLLLTAMIKISDHDHDRMWSAGFQVIHVRGKGSSTCSLYTQQKRAHSALQFLLLSWRFTSIETRTY